jgi:hypothetical protein
MLCRSCLLETRGNDMFNLPKEVENTLQTINQGYGRETQLKKINSDLTRLLSAINEMQILEDLNKEESRFGEYKLRVECVERELVRVQLSLWSLFLLLEGDNNGDLLAIVKVMMAKKLDGRFKRFKLNMK